MNLVCKACSALIPPADANIAEGVCTCRQCGGFFKIAALLKDDSVVSRMARPAYSRVQFVAERDSVCLIVPPGGNRGTGVFLLLFSLFWNTISWVMFIAAIRDKQLFPVLFMTIFVAVGAGVGLIALYMFFGEFSVVADNRELRATWSLFKWSRKKIVPVSTITAVTEDVVYTKNYQPVYGVSIRHGINKSVKFGSGLSEEERRWLIGELRHFFRVGG